ncbi:RNA-binding domain-containing protein [Hesseltinella vesiculosa]|uniref:RNA-binding domain-containing protein n=1 Tax=Hesseltinella vesiculosa TaxID=101127 RepID=A0A1X2GVG0_9FUNG|nr:RNA-binding domain-containing protein [Hesseltinella vesiculosa]
MPSDDHLSSHRLYVGRLNPTVGRHEVKDMFSKYGRVVDVQLFPNYGFVEFDRSRDAKEARRFLHGHKIAGERLLVDYATEPGRNKERRSRPTTDSERCYNCGQNGHVSMRQGTGERAKLYKDNRCFACGEPGHRMANCPSGGSKRSRHRSRSPRRRSVSPRSRTRSPRRSRSRTSRRSRSRSPQRSRSRSPKRNRSRSPKRNRSRSPKRSRSRSPRQSPRNGKDRSMSRSLSPRRSRSPE